jgi:hypothetical protein
MASTKQDILDNVVRFSGDGCPNEPRLPPTKRALEAQAQEGEDAPMMKKPPAASVTKRKGE